MSLNPYSDYYIDFALVMVGLMIVFIPREFIRRFFGFSLVWGYMGSLVFAKIFDHGLLNLLHWGKAGPFVFLGSPLLLNLAWAAAIMLFIYFIPRDKVLYYLYLIAFSSVSAGLDEMFHRAGVLEYFGWNPFFRFIIGLLWFGGVTWHYHHLTKRNDEP